jgi:protein TonB
VTGTDANRVPPSYELTDELARYCLPAANRDPNRTLAWVNSICLLFLIIGVVGARNGAIRLQPPPPLEEVAPVVIEPPPPPQQVSPSETPKQNEPQKPEAAQVVVVTPETPAINFAVPTIGSVVAPSSLAEAPPLNPLQPVERAVGRPSTVNTTGAGGERPSPPYPEIAEEEAQQGTVRLLMTADEAGNVVSVELEQSSGFGILDRSTMEFVKRHWTLPVGTGNRQFETSITYRLQNN